MICTFIGLLFSAGYGNMLLGGKAESQPNTETEDDNMSKKRYYIAYGSNLNKAQMQQRCPGAKPIGTGLLEGYELLFKGSKTGCYLTIEPKADGVVPIVVWEVSAEHERSLDHYEGCPVCYYKKQLRLPVFRTKSGRTIQTNGFVYIMHESRRLGEPNPRYFWTCVRGYRAFGFDPEFLYEAYERSAKGVR